MAIRKILQAEIVGGSTWEDDFLHKGVKQVDKIDESVLSAIQDLQDTLNAYPFCMGLSAPQIGIDYAISIIKLRNENEKNELILINPVITNTSGKKDKKRESCMSVWGKAGEVQRRDKISLIYRDIDFNEKHLECSGILSRTIQHEIDHLHGVLYPEKIVDGTSLRHADFYDSYTILGEFIKEGN